MNLDVSVAPSLPLTPRLHCTYALLVGLCQPHAWDSTVVQSLAMHVAYQEAMVLHGLKSLMEPLISKMGYW